MTYEEAKMQIQAIPEKIWDQLSEPDREAMEMAFSALERQIPKKLIAEGGGYADGSMIYDSFYCPSCDHRMEEDEVKDYCPECGQKICWEDEQ